MKRSPTTEFGSLPELDAVEEQIVGLRESVKLVESVHGMMTRPCAVCRGGWWDDPAGKNFIRVHHGDCPRKDDE